MKLIIIQPAIPRYRVPFFNLLSYKYNLSLISAKMDFLGVNSILDLPYAHYHDNFINFFGKAFWLNGLSLYSSYKKGDVVVINGNPRIINFMILFLILRVRGIKTIWWGHGWSAGSHGLLSKLRILMMKIACAILVYTDKEKSSLNFPRVFALNNGLDSNEIRKAITISNAIERSFDDKFYLVFIGRITKKAQFDTILNALKYTNNNIHLNVIGDDHNCVYYKSLSQTLGVSDRIHWYGAIFDEHIIAKIMVSSHAFIYAGSVGLSLIHAFNYGLPAIIHSNSKNHMPEFAAFEDGYNGISFEENNESDLGCKIEQLYMFDKAKYINMSNNAFKTIVDSYNVNDMVIRFDDMLRTL